MRINFQGAAVSGHRLGQQFGALGARGPDGLLFEGVAQIGVPAASARKFTLAYCTQYTDPHCRLDRVDFRPISNFSTQDQPHDRGAVYSVKYGPAGAEFSVDPYFTHVFHAMFAGFGRLGAIFYSKKAKNGVLRVNFGAVAAGTP